MNIVEIAGHLGADAEVRFTPSNLKVTTLRMAVNTRKGGTDVTMWWRVTIWGDRFDKMVPYFKKGAALIVLGEMANPEIYTDKNGIPQVSLNLTADIVKFSPFGKSDRSSQEAGSGQESYGAEAKSSSTPFAGQAQYSYASSDSDSFKDDQLPF
ncbi:MAG: single-stranded DNA-binding protein [Chlamydiales bacterium]|nr:single-stranded DNA-binding protein [Chlamydiales bacterium]